MVKDEINGFYRSKVMAILLIGLPALSVMLYFLSPDLGVLPLGAFTAMLAASIAGMLASTTLSVAIINERSQGAFDLFLVRPVKRSHLLLAKYIAVVACVIAAAALALVLANAYDWYRSGAVDLGMMVQPMLVIVTMACIASAAAVLFGTLTKSVLVGVILTIYGGNQLSAAVVLPALLQDVLPFEATVAIGLVISAIVRAGAVVVFKRKRSN